MPECQFVFCVWRGGFWVVRVSCWAMQAFRGSAGQLPISGLQNALGHAQYVVLSLWPHTSKKPLKCSYSPHHGQSWPDTGPRPNCPCAVDSWKVTVDGTDTLSFSVPKMWCLCISWSWHGQIKLRTWSVGEHRLLLSFHHPFTANIHLASWHLLEQDGSKLSGRCSLLTPTLPPEEGGKEEKGESLTNWI